MYQKCQNWGAKEAECYKYFLDIYYLQSKQTVLCSGKSIMLEFDGPMNLFLTTLNKNHEMSSFPFYSLVDKGPESVLLESLQPR